MASGYRTNELTLALQDITSIVYIDLLIEERGDGYQTQVKLEKRERRLEHKIQWTKRIILDIRKWLSCKHRTINYHMT